MVGRARLVGPTLGAPLGAVLSISAWVAACGDASAPFEPACHDGIASEGELCFAPARTFEAEGGPSALVVADLDADGHADFVMGGTTASVVEVFLGDGAGNFERSTYAAGPMIDSLRAADLDADGDLDLVVALRFEAAVGVLLGEGDGTFGSSEAFALGAEPPDYFELTQAVPADLDGDGHVDVIAGGWGAPSLWVFRGRGDGTLDLGAPLVAEADLTHGLGVADLDGDASLDVVAATHSGLGVLTSMLNDGAGGLVTAQIAPVNAQPSTPVLVDLDSDGHLDVVTASSGAAALSVLRGRGDGTFEQGVTLDVGDGSIGDNAGPVASAVADLDGDTLLDAIAVNRRSDSISLLMMKDAAQLAFDAPLVMEVCDAPAGVAVGDFNEDGLADLVVTCSETTEDWLSPGSVWSGGAVSVLLSDP